MEKLDGYQEEQPDQSIDELREVVKQIMTCGESCDRLYAEFEQVAHLRRMYYAAGSNSLKGVAMTLWHLFCKEFPPRTLQHQIIQLIWDRLRNQQALAAPTHLFRPNGVRSLRQYRQSYLSLLESFDLLLTIVQATGFQLNSDVAQLDSLRLRFRASDAQVENVLTQLITAHQERIRLYNELSVRTGAVIDRVRQLYGASHLAYRRMRYCKV